MILTIISIPPLHSICCVSLYIRIGSDVPKILIILTKKIKLISI